MRLLADENERDPDDGQRQLLQRLADEHLGRRESARRRTGPGRQAS
jgi:hypothetical protein